MNVTTTRWNDPPARTMPDAPGWTRSIAVGVGLWGLSRLVLGLIGACGFALDGRPVPWLGMWVQWDASYYLSIIGQGYVPPHLVTGEETGQSNLNFFPLLPLGARLLMSFGLPPVAAALAFANACLVLAAIGLHRLATLRSGRDAGDWAVLSMMVLPGSFSLSGVMSEPVFLAVSVWAFLLARDGRWAWASLIGALLPVTRVTGIGLVAGLGVDWVRARARGWRASYGDLFLILLIPVPLLAFMLYMHALTGDGLAFVHSQFSFWQHRMGVPFQNFLMFLWTDQPRLHLQAAVALSMLAVFLSQLRRIGGSEIVFVLLNMLSFSSSLSAGPSLLRYMLSLYPLYLALGLLCAKGPAARLYLLALAMLNGALMLLWVRGHDVYI